MKRHLLAYVIVIVASVALIAALVPRMQSAGDGGAGDTPGAAGQADPANQSGPEGPGGPGPGDAAGERADVPARPDCPGATVAGVDLDCLGGAESDGEVSAGAPTVVNVWAWWCAPCREELPVIAEYAAAHPDHRVVGVHADPDGARGAALLEELGVDLPSFQDDSGAFQGGLSLPAVVPVTLLVEDGQVTKTLPKPYTSLAELEADLEA